MFNHAQRQYSSQVAQTGVLLPAPSSGSGAVKKACLEQQNCLSRLFICENSLCLFSFLSMLSF